MSEGFPSALPRSLYGRLLSVGAVLLLVVLAVSVCLQRMRDATASRAAFPLEKGRIAVEGIDSPIAIHRDVRGVPHVEAVTEDDAFFGLGFVHAQDRLGQMLWLVRLARGRSAEVVGPEGLPADRLARTLDFAGLAEAEFERLDPALRESLRAYVRGVNARIRRIRDARVGAPLSLAGGPGSIEDWQPADSLALLKLYSWGLSRSLDVIPVLNDLIEHLGGFRARRFFPRLPDALPARLPVTAAAPGAIRGGQPGAGDALRRAAGLDGRGIGSSAWVVGGANTRSGAPILVADAHHETTAPSMVYVAHFRGGDLDVAGATIPGVPVVWTGTNGSVAWASTYAQAVTSDLYEEKLNPTDAGLYHDGRDWREIGERVEILRVSGGAAEKLTVRSTRHGPLVDGLLEGDRKPLALTWAGARARGRSALGSLLAVARARSADALREALASHEDPPLAVVYAAADGGAGMQVAGWIPNRPLASGLVPLPGPVRWYDWLGRIDFDDLPRRELREGRGWAIAADNPLSVSAEDAVVEWLWRSGTRADRIAALLREAVAAGPVNLRGMTALQADVGVERARALIASALTFIDGGGPLGAEADEVVGLLRRWDGRAEERSVGAAAYHVFLDSLTRRLLEPGLGSELLRRYLALPPADPEQVVFEIVRDAEAGGDGDGWSDPDIVGAAVRESLRETWFSLSFRLGSNRNKWHWGRLHLLQFRAFVPSAAGVAHVAALGPFAYGGSGSTLRTAQYDPAAPFDVRVASTFRYAVDATALDQALFSLAPGQSEHPGHPHFADTLTNWRQGRPSLLATAPLLVEESSQARLLLEPAS